MALRTRLGFLVVASLCFASSLASAQNDEEFSLDDETSEPSKKPSKEPEQLEGQRILTDEQALQEEQDGGEKFRQSTDPYEDPKTPYLSAGLTWRYLRLPSWALEMFLEAAPSVGTAGSIFGEVAYRKDGFQITGSLGYMNWDFHGPFQIAGDPDKDTEWLDGDFSLLMGSAAFTWSTAFTDWFALEYGIEAGLGFIFGELTRTEAYKTNDGEFKRCPGPLTGPLPDSNVAATYCATPIIPEGSPPGTPAPATNEADEEGEHYFVKAPKGIANQGIPRALPFAGPRLSLRFKPIHQLILRVDVPMPVAPFGFMGGLSAHYGF